jgi:hypothetical protein
MFRKIGLAALLGAALASSAQEASAQDILGGALLGGAAGAIIGGAAGHGRGAGIGALIGAAAGAVIAAEGQRRRGSYYSWRNGCYLQRGDGYWVRVSSRYCGAVEVVPVAPAVYGDPAVAACARRFRSYDPVSQTYMGYDGLRRRCP